MQMEYWTDQMVTYLKRWYKKKGDVELAEIFQEKFPKIKPWTKKHIEKKRRYLGLKRTKKQLQDIFTHNKVSGRLAVANQKRWETSPPNEVGDIKIHQGRKKIKTNQGYSSYARFMYVKHIGAISDDEIIINLDGNAVNCAPANLYKIKRSAHGSLNRILSRFPPLSPEDRTFVKKFYLGLIPDKTDASLRKIFALKNGYKNLSDAVYNIGSGIIFNQKFNTFKNNKHFTKPII
jgi:hypothetical protein